VKKTDPKTNKFSDMKNDYTFNTFFSISLKLANPQTCTLPCQGLFNDIKSKVEGKGKGMGGAHGLGGL
jgi:hypothetical protein